LGVRLQLVPGHIESITAKRPTNVLKHWSVFSIDLIYFFSQPQEYTVSIEACCPFSDLFYSSGGQGNQCEYLRFS